MNWYPSIYPVEDDEPVRDFWEEQRKIDERMEELIEMERRISPENVVHSAQGWGWEVKE